MTINVSFIYASFRLPCGLLLKTVHMLDHSFDLFQITRK